MVPDPVVPVAGPSRTKHVHSVPMGDTAEGEGTGSMGRLEARRGAPLPTLRDSPSTNHHSRSPVPALDSPHPSRSPPHAGSSSRPIGASSRPEKRKAGTDSPPPSKRARRSPSGLRAQPDAIVDLTAESDDELSSDRSTREEAHPRPRRPIDLTFENDGEMVSDDSTDDSDIVMVRRAAKAGELTGKATSEEEGPESAEQDQLLEEDVLEDGEGGTGEGALVQSAPQPPHISSSRSHRPTPSRPQTPALEQSPASPGHDDRKPPPSSSLPAPHSKPPFLWRNIRTALAAAVKSRRPSAPQEKDMPSGMERGQPRRMTGVERLEAFTWKSHFREENIQTARQIHYLNLTLHRLKVSEIAGPNVATSQRALQGIHSSTRARVSVDLEGSSDVVAVQPVYLSKLSFPARPVLQIDPSLAQDQHTSGRALRYSIAVSVNVGDTWHDYTSARSIRLVDPEGRYTSFAGPLSIALRPSSSTAPQLTLIVEPSWSTSPPWMLKPLPRKIIMPDPLLSRDTITLRYLFHEAHGTVRETVVKQWRCGCCHPGLGDMGNEERWLLHMKVAHRYEWELEDEDGAFELIEGGRMLTFNLHPSRVKAPPTPPQVSPTPPAYDALQGNGKSQNTHEDDEVNDDEVGQGAGQEQEQEEEQETINEANGPGTGLMATEGEDEYGADPSLELDESVMAELASLLGAEEENAGGSKEGGEDKNQDMDRRAEKAESSEPGHSDVPHAAKQTTEAAPASRQLTPLNPSPPTPLNSSPARSPFHADGYPATAVVEDVHRGGSVSGPEIVGRVPEHPALQEVVGHSNRPDIEKRARQGSRKNEAAGRPRVRLEDLSVTRSQPRREEPDVGSEEEGVRIWTPVETEDKQGRASAEPDTGSAKAKGEGQYGHAGYEGDGSLVGDGNHGAPSYPATPRSTTPMSPHPAEFLTHQLYLRPSQLPRCSSSTPISEPNSPPRTHSGSFALAPPQLQPAPVSAQPAQPTLPSGGAFVLPAKGMESWPSEPSEYPAHRPFMSVIKHQLGSLHQPRTSSGEPQGEISSGSAAPVSPSRLTTQQHGDITFRIIAPTQSSQPSQPLPQAPPDLPSPSTSSSSSALPTRPIPLTPRGTSATASLSASSATSIRRYTQSGLAEPFMRNRENNGYTTWSSRIEPGKVSDLMGELDKIWDGGKFRHVMRDQEERLVWTQAQMSHERRFLGCCWNRWVHQHGPIPNSDYAAGYLKQWFDNYGPIMYRAGLALEVKDWLHLHLKNRHIQIAHFLGACEYWNSMRLTLREQQSESL
ncbi:hypothetical protein IAT38_005243 [Cryptococcus sp. DSM 104549]